jgi:hypothetical protein
MAYSDFNLEVACSSFTLELNQDEDLFVKVPAVPVSPLLRAVLDEYVPLATAIHTDKARSEFIVAPLLAEVRKVAKQRISLFSGVEFNVEPAQGLNGTCDFILACSPVQLFVQSPVVMIVEAKNDNIKSGLGQCLAEMVAARVFNRREREGPETIHGAVTTGSIWKFLKLDDGTIFVDRPEYYIDRVDKVLGIFLHCVGTDPATVGAAA